MLWSRMRGTVYAFRFACMHLYASGDAYRKSPEKARKPLYIKGKTEFLSLVCIVCINIRGFLPFSRIPYKGTMHTMHTRPRTIPGTSETSRNGKRRCMHPRMHTDAYTRPGMHTRPGAGDRRPPFCREGAPPLGVGRTSSDPPIRFAGLPGGSRCCGAACAGPCMHSGSRVCICMHPGMHTEKARKKPENPYI